MSKRFELINLLNAHDKFRDNEQCVEFDSFEAERTLNHYYELLVEQDQRITELEEQLGNKQAEFGCVEETIKLELPKFEDFREPIGFMGKDNIKYYILKWQDCICIWGNDNVFRLICEYTKKNYTTVCEYARALFLKGAE